MSKLLTGTVYEGVGGEIAYIEKGATGETLYLSRTIFKRVFFSLDLMSYIFTLFSFYSLVTGAEV